MIVLKKLKRMTFSHLIVLHFTETRSSSFLNQINTTWCLHGLQDNSPTNQLAVSQVADWITRGLVNSRTTNF